MKETVNTSLPNDRESDASRRFLPRETAETLTELREMAAG